jgi:DNA-binding response OmpR family regulator
VPQRILLIEDDARLAGMVSDYLGEAGYRVSVRGAGYVFAKSQDS